MTQDEIIEMARQADIGLEDEYQYQVINLAELEAFAKLVAAHAVDKDRKEFDIDELCARQNKIGYKQGYNAGVLAEREACAQVIEFHGPTLANGPMLAKQIRARGEA